jgi:hypothetical protein
MADWFVKLWTMNGDYIGEYSLMNPEAEVRNSEVGGMSGEIALGQKRRDQPLVGIARDSIAPYRVVFELWRQSTGTGVCITDGMLTSINLNFNRDTVLIAGKDWKHYLQRRIYPFSPEDYITYSLETKHRYWDKWPKKWHRPDLTLPAHSITNPNPDLRLIVRDLLFSMKYDTPVDTSTTQSERTTIENGGTALGVPEITWNLSDTESRILGYKIYPGDQTSIYDHIQKLSEMKDGFEWDILPVTKEFKMWAPAKYENNAWWSYWFAPSEFEVDGALTEFDWTNEGPNGTYLIGLGSGRHKSGATWTTVKNRTEFGRYDKVYDYGEISGYDLILNKLKDQNDLWPQKKLQISLLNPEFLPTNFYTGGRPRSLIGDTVRVTQDFAPLHEVNAYFQINAIKWSVDKSTNETVALELMQIYEPEDGSSGGIPLRTM